jgi:hypothetical protein
MTATTIETGRITLTLTAETIKELRVLALLTGQNQNETAEDLLIKGGLRAAVDRQLSALKPEHTPEHPLIPNGVPTPTAPAHVHEFPPAPKPEPPRAAVTVPVYSPHSSDVAGTEDEVPW